MQVLNHTSAKEGRKEVVILDLYSMIVPAADSRTLRGPPLSEENSVVWRTVLAHALLKSPPKGLS